MTVSLVQQSFSNPPPHDFIAEQSILGCLMAKNAIGEKILWLKSEYFASPLHGRIFDICMNLIRNGKSATPVTVKPYLANDDDLVSQGGDEYLVRLVGSAASIITTEDYARLVVDLHLRRALIGLGEDVVNAAFATPDAAAQIATAIAGLDDLGRQIGQDGLRSAADYRSDVVELYLGKRKIPLSTGFSCLDTLYRIRPGELSVVTGAPSSGKSELVDAIAVNLAMREGWKFAVCSFENPTDEHIGKLCEKYLGMPFHDGPTSRMNEAELNRAMAWVNDHFYFICADKDSPTIEWALARARGAVDRFGIKGLILDPYNEFEHRRPNGMSEPEYISQSLGSVKRFLSNNSVHGWFIAHPAKPQKDQRDEVPSLYDISGAAHWANKADCGLSINRPYLPTGERSCEVEVHVKKIRFRVCGKPGIAKLEFVPSTGRYREPDPVMRGHWNDN
jgi:replicative DNA helicase